MRKSHPALLAYWREIHRRETLEGRRRNNAGQITKPWRYHCTMSYIIECLVIGAGEQPCEVARTLGVSRQLVSQVISPQRIRRILKGKY